MTSPTEDYLEARQAFERARANVQKIAGTVGAVARALERNPEKFIFSNYGSWPIEASMSGDSVSVDANEWPSVKDIHDAVTELHTARSTMTDAWSRISAEKKQGLKPPP